MDLNELCKFLVKAKKSTYAAGDIAKKIVEDDKSTTMIFENGDWKYHDNYFGGEPYGGREVVFFRNMPVYMMVYYGWVIEGVSDVQAVYKTLQGALSLLPEDKPFRGPKKYNLNGIEYSNEYEGEIDNFFGTEIIKSDDGNEIYKARYIGGLIDQRK
ncbi:hypothetical protein A2303_03260 [Candidatus Falkowbacteria bacterium RIFOXYB2_FULL_47_14]|uniref:DUF5680 domain-containing protein n=1 Tax=Candidatus Falkowbacteria bacterium RIFOXYA2_FULL_47_19 TaxID=1797994 RepID=A0A1F5SKZ1_9BACT|nr:MAG: hypothetical protein A2227_04355 [Candidatus Falkowbacteria bacterium RIFOXYA2_FULL_47_19]OGF37021.1 MAG: hypothetical protein A2468_01295 [Candidatus Falkowbacteria bacterium RIFOXYC2_FULL_46_15]OGF44056.1 MAG: hypothetical protein A2303_03260 [Candidatus Falkowbacteria bacterium RIFOXYB2_FULL_47_14]